MPSSLGDSLFEFAAEERFCLGDMLSDRVDRMSGEIRDLINEETFEMQLVAESDAFGKRVSHRTEGVPHFFGQRVDGSLHRRGQIEIPAGARFGPSLTFVVVVACAEPYEGARKRQGKRPGAFPLFPGFFDLCPFTGFFHPVEELEDDSTYLGTVRFQAPARVAGIIEGCYDGI